MTTTTAAVLRTLGEPMRLEDVALDAPAADEVLVRIAGVGVCHTDVSALDGTMPRPLPTVLGHEGSGVVEAIGDDVSHVAPGDTVVLTFDHCGACRWCCDGQSAYCESFVPRNYSGKRLDGTVTLARDGEDIHGNWLGQSSFAHHALATARSAVKVQTALPLEILGPLSCGLQTGAGAVLNVLKPAAGESIAVFGLGAVGLSAVMAAAATGCTTVIAIDPVAERRALAMELGATHELDPAAVDDVVKAVKRIAPAGVACSVDAVGAGPVIASALRILRTPGMCATLGFRGNRHDITIDQGHLLFGRGLIGVVEGGGDPQTFIPALLDLHAEGKFPFERLIETFPFSQINEAFEGLESGRVVKPVLVL